MKKKTFHLFDCVVVDLLLFVNLENVKNDLVMEKYCISSARDSKNRTTECHPTKERQIVVFFHFSCWCCFAVNNLEEWCNFITYINNNHETTEY